ncbi:uncharacterized protein TNCV_3171181 [Trichonephila clavipes]|nr:uncharacterized protein TNCV_3171181 [Trichonephila clavipes]
MRHQHGHNATETFAKFQQAYGDSVLTRAQVFQWFKAFSEGRESIEDEPRSGRPSVSKTAENVVSPGSCAFRSSLDSLAFTVLLLRETKLYDNWKEVGF